MVKVPRGIVIIKQEKIPGRKVQVPAYYVLEDDSELSGSDIRDPKQASDPQTSEPIVTFSFTDAGRKAFARATKREAQRGQNLLAPGVPNQAKFQRFAISLPEWHRIMQRLDLDELVIERHAIANPAGRHRIVGSPFAA